MIVSGDLTEHGSLAEYQALARLLDRLPIPVYAIPGNHDRREPLRAAFADKKYMPARGPIDYVVDHLGVRMVGLDTLVVQAMGNSAAAVCRS